MHYRDAWKLLNVDKLIRRSTWPAGRHVRYIKPIGYAIYDVSGMREILEITRADRIASDWTEYETR